jgi:hypothetical protein
MWRSCSRASFFVTSSTEMPLVAASISGRNTANIQLSRPLGDRSELRSETALLRVHLFLQILHLARDHQQLLLQRCRRAGELLWDAERLHYVAIELRIISAIGRRLGRARRCKLPVLDCRPCDWMLFDLLDRHLGG